MKNSFGSQGLLTVGDRRFTIFGLGAVEKAFPEASTLPSRSRYSWKTCCGPRTDKMCEPRTSSPWRVAGRSGAEPRNRFYAQPHSPSGFHRRAGGSGLRRHARRDEANGRRPPPHQSPLARRAGHRSFGPGRCLWEQSRLSHERRDGVRAIASDTPFFAGARRHFATFSSFRPTRESSTRSTSSTWLASSSPMRVPSRFRSPTPTRSWALIRTRR